jgi:hypothetical protein
VPDRGIAEAGQYEDHSFIAIDLGHVCPELPASASVRIWSAANMNAYAERREARRKQRTLTLIPFVILIVGALIYKAGIWIGLLVLIGTPVVLVGIGYIYRAGTMRTEHKHALPESTQAGPRGCQKCMNTRSSPKITDASETTKRSCLDA